MTDDNIIIDGVVGFIGAGNMAQAIVFPLIKKGILNPQNVIVSATSQNNLQHWQELGCKTTLKNSDVFSSGDIIFWAVKPQIFPGAVSRLEQELGSNVACRSANVPHISIMAGIPLVGFQEKVQNLMCISKRGSARCFRVMPNVGLKVSCGVAVFCGPPDVTETERRLLHSFFKPLGLSYEVPEHQINAYCGLFGSGIGFMFPIIEALSDGAVKVGIPRNISLEIASQVMKGAGELILQEKLHPGIMKDSVCSPGGTTIAGVACLEEGGVRSAIIKAVEAATMRGEVLGAAKPSK